MFHRSVVLRPVPGSLLELEVTPASTLPTEQHGLPGSLLGLEEAEQWCVVLSRLPCV